MTREEYLKKMQSYREELQAECKRNRETQAIKLVLSMTNDSRYTKTITL